MLQITGKIGVFATAGVVDQLMRYTKMPGAHRHMNPAHGIHRQNGFGPTIGVQFHLHAVECRLQILC